MQRLNHELLASHCGAMIKRAFTLAVVLAGFVYTLAAQTAFQGRVRDANGDPVSGVSIVAEPLLATSDESGFFFLAGRTSASSVTVSSPGYQSETIPLTADTSIGHLITLYRTAEQPPAAAVTVNRSWQSRNGARATQWGGATYNWLGDQIAAYNKEAAIENLEITFEVITLANEYVAVDIAPAMGMRILAARDLTAGSPVDIFRTTNTFEAFRWTNAGGVEPSFPFYEVGTDIFLQDAGSLVIHHDDGAVTVAMNMRMAHRQDQKDMAFLGKFGDRPLSCMVTLRPGTNLFEVTYRAENPNPLRRADRIWNNAQFPKDPIDISKTVPLFPVYWAMDHGHMGDVIWEVNGTMNYSHRSHFGLNPRFPFAGAWYPAENANRLRITDPERFPGTKLYYDTNWESEFFELWGSTNSLFEAPGWFVGAYEPLELTEKYCLVRGIGKVAYADSNIAIAIPSSGTFHLTAMRDGAVTVHDADGVVIDNQQVGPSTVISGTYVNPLNVFLDGRQAFSGSLPLTIPNNYSEYEPIRHSAQLARTTSNLADGYDRVFTIEMEPVASREQTLSGLAASKLDPALAPVGQPSRVLSAARAHYNLGRLDAARTFLGLVDTLTYPSYADTVCWLDALIAWEKGEPVDFRSAGVIATYHRALAALATGERAEAVTLLQEYVDAHPGTYRPRLLLAYLTDDLALAGRCAMENPGSPEALYVLASLGHPPAAAALVELLSVSTDCDLALLDFVREASQGVWRHGRRFEFDDVLPPSYAFPPELVRDGAPLVPTVVLQPMRRNLDESPVRLTFLAIGRPEPSYQWYRDGAPVEGETSPTLDLGFIESAERGVYTCEAVNAEGRVVSEPVDYSMSATHVVVHRINCGMDRYNSAEWEADNAYVSGGAEWGNPDSLLISIAGVANAAPVDIYKTVRRQSPHSYDIDCPDGNFLVRLHFIDKYSGRTMDYFAEGVQLLDDFDINDITGAANTPLVMDFPLSVSDGNGLQIECVGDDGSDVFEAGIEIIRAQPAVMSVNAEGNPNRILVTFDRPVQESSAARIAHYAVDNGITITGAELHANRLTAALTVTSLSTDIRYNLTVRDIADAFDPAVVIAPAVVNAFTYEPSTPPALTGVRAVEDDHAVFVTFNEPLEPASAQDPDKYAIDNGVSVSAAVLQPDQMTVALSTSVLRPDIDYLLTVTGVTDRAGVAMGAESLSFRFLPYTPRIMPLGNSITYDNHSGDARPDGERISYRYRLYELLKNDGLPFQFVGSEYAGFTHFQPDTHQAWCAGFPGITDGQIATLLSTGENTGGWRTGCRTCPKPYLDSIWADYVLLHIGTNHLNSSASDVEDILNEIDYAEERRGKPITVALSRIINRTCCTDASPCSQCNTTTLFNDNVEAMARARLTRTPDSDRIVFVDLEDGCGIDYRLTGAGGDMYDNLHPDQPGYNKMAEGWHRALAPMLRGKPAALVQAPAHRSRHAFGAAIPLMVEVFNFDGVVEKVEFFADGAKIGEDVTADRGTAFSLSWSGASHGMHKVAAVATYDGGDTVWTVPIEIAVPWRIVALGNSITQSNSSHYSYRYTLWKKLIDFEEPFDFVGSMTDNNGGNPDWPLYKGNAFDRDHEGHWGWRVDEILNEATWDAQGKLHEWLQTYTPDIALIHLGSNDMFQGDDIAETIGELDMVIDSLRGDNPAVRILLAQLIPTTRSEEPQIQALNEEIAALAAAKHTENAPVALVDQWTGYDAAGDNFDGVHPNASGEEKMATKWFDAMRRFLGVAAPSISPEGGSFRDTAVVTLGTPTPDASIYYTTDGSTPTQSDDVYSGPIRFEGDLQFTLRARTWLNDGTDSSGVSSAAFDIVYDRTPPVVMAVNAPEPALVRIRFDEPVDETTAETVGNYDIDNDVSIIAAVLQPDFTTVLLTTTALAEGVVYTISVSGIADRSLAGNVIASPAAHVFSYDSWQNQDIGSVSAAGSMTHNSGIFTIEGSGADIWNNADEFHFVYRQFSGDGEIIARVVNVENTNAWAKAGVMFRDNLTAGSRHAMTVVTPGNGTSFQRRTAAGGSSSSTSVGSASAPRWVRLVRSGSTFSAYHSGDGLSWSFIGEEVLDMPQRVYAGLAVTSHSDGALCAAEVDNVAALAANEPPSVVITAPASDARFDSGAPITISANASDNDGSVIGVTFYDGESLIDEDVSEPFTADLVSPSRGRHMLWVQATDNQGATSADTVYVSSGNSAPVADAGGDQSVNERATVTLDGAGSYDPDGDLLTFTWRQIIGGTAVLDDPRAEMPMFEAPPVVEAFTIAFEVTVSDGEYDDKDTVAVTVNGSYDNSDFAEYTHIGPAGSLPYRMYVPPGYDGAEALPLMLFLHGAGGRGTDNSQQINEYEGARIWAQADKQRDHPCIVVAPQCPGDWQWSNLCNDFYQPLTDPPLGPDDCWNNDIGPHWQVDPVSAQQIVADLLDTLLEQFTVDTNRVYLSGQSMGAYGAWDFAARYPERFAAVVPAAGGGSPARADVLKTMGVWAFHGDADGTVPEPGSGDVIDSLWARGGFPRYTIFPGRGHNIWPDAWNTADLVPWVFAHRKNDDTPPAAPVISATPNDNSVTLHFSGADDAESGVVCYHIYRDGVRVGMSRIAQCIDTGLEAAQTYEYTAVAINGSRLVSPVSIPLNVETIAESGALTLNDFDNYRVFQRDLVDRDFTLTVAGSYTGGDVARIEARVLDYADGGAIVDWTTIDSDLSDGSYSGEVTAGEGGWYRIQTRALSGASEPLDTATGAHKWGVGIVILAIGQSNMEGSGDLRSGESYTIAHDLVANFTTSGVWGHLVDPYQNKASAAPALGNALVAQYGIPVAFVPASAGGTQLHCDPGNTNCWMYLNEADSADVTTRYGNSLARARAAGGVELIVMHQGESDASNNDADNPNTNEEQYEADMLTLLERYRVSLYNTIPLFYCQLGTNGGGWGRTDETIGFIRNAQHDIDNPADSLFLGATCMDLPREDNSHYTVDGYNTLGERLANAVMAFYGDRPHHRGPAIVGANYTSGEKTAVRVAIEHRGGTDITPQSAIAGFEVLDGGAGVQINNVYRYRADTCIIQLEQAVSGAGTLRYLYGLTPDVSRMAYDNSPASLPLENTTASLNIGAPLPINTAPMVNAGVDQAASFPATIALNGRVDDDGRPAGGSVTTLWEQVEGPESAIISDPLSLTPTIELPSFGTWRFRLSANDGELTADDTIAITGARTFAFGSDDYTATSPNLEGVEYTKVNQSGPAFLYDAARGYGYSDTTGIDHSPNNRNSTACEIYDQFTAVYDGADIAFRVDVPNGEYRFVMAGGDPDHTQTHTIRVRDGSGGETITVFETLETPADHLYAVGFDGKQPPSCIDMSVAASFESPTLTVTAGYIEVIQNAPINGGLLSVLEIWPVGGNQAPTAVAGADITVTDLDGDGQEIIRLNGTGSYDSDGVILTYGWTEGESEIAATAQADISFPVGEHTIILTVTDDQGAIGADEIVVTVDAAEEMHPRLFVDQARIDAINAARSVPGSHHALAFAEMQARADQNDWTIYDENDGDGNYNYARGYMATEQALLYLLTGNTDYAQMAYDALALMYNDPDPDGRALESGYGLSRAMLAKAWAMVYDWCYNAWDAGQRAYVRDKMIVALDAWPSYAHANLDDVDRNSNWVAVCRGAELILMLSAYEESPRGVRYTQIREHLNTHITNAYGAGGLSQEGIGYASYAGQFLIPAVIACRNVNDGSLDAAFDSKLFWKLAMYAYSQTPEVFMIQAGVDGTGYDHSGWLSALLGQTPSDMAAHYYHFYNQTIGLGSSQPEGERFDFRRAGAVWALAFYNENVSSSDPTGVFSRMHQDSEHGGYFFRTGWRGTTDILATVMADEARLNHAWDAAEGFQINLIAYGAKLIGGPGKTTTADAFSTLLVDGANHLNASDTATTELFEVSGSRGYVIIDGGQKYQNLGIAGAKRHVILDFADDMTPIISTLDQLTDARSHTYSWQINIGDAQGDLGITTSKTVESGVPAFLLSAPNGAYAKGWVLSPVDATITTGDPLRVSVTEDNAEIWVVMTTGTGSAPTAVVHGVGMEAVLEAGDALATFDEGAGRIDIQRISPPVISSSPVTAAVEDQLYAYDVDATSNLGGAITYSLVEAPAGMSINQQDGFIQWTPDNADALIGSFDVIVRATDDAATDLYADHSFHITVAPVNDAPVVSGILDQVVSEGQPFALIALDDHVADPDNDDADMSWTATGEGALQVDINHAMRTVAISAPDPEWSGAEEITFTATDPGGATAGQIALFTIIAINDEPIVSGIPEQSIDEGESFSAITLDTYVTDNDNSDETLVWSHDATHLTVTIGPDRIAMVSAPDENWYGTESVTFTATDPGGASGRYAAAFTVRPVNDAPSVSAFADQTIAMSETFEPVNLDDFVHDIDNEDAEIAWSWNGASALSVTVDEQRIATFERTDPLWYGAETITFTAADPGGLTGSVSATFTVELTPPEIIADPSSKTALEGESVTFSVTVNGYALSYQWQADSVDIDDATGAEYTIPLALMAHDGAAYRCIVSNAAGRDTSLSATLTVSADAPGSITISGLSDTAVVFAYATSDWGGSPVLEGNGTIEGLSAGTHILRVRDGDSRDRYMPVMIRSSADTAIDFFTSPAIPLSVQDTASILADEQPVYVGAVVSASVADLDRDGDQDLLTLSPTGQINFFANENGSLATAAGPRYLGGSSLEYFDGQCIRIADVNSDNRPDILVAALDGAVSIFENIAPAAEMVFAPAELWYTANADLTGFDLSDLNSDNLIDLVLGYGDGSLTCALGGAGGWQRQTAIQSFSGGELSGVALDAAPCAIDLTGDNLPDLVVADGNGGCAFFENMGGLGFLDRGALTSAGDSLNVTGPAAIARAAGFYSELPALILGDGAGFVYRLDTWLRADFNSDGVVDVHDLGLFGDAWYSTQTDEAWNAMFNLDLTAQGGVQVIDTRDLGVLGDSWGRKINAAGD